VDQLLAVPTTVSSLPFACLRGSPLYSFLPSFLLFFHHTPFHRPHVSASSHFWFLNHSPASRTVSRKTFAVPSLNFLASADLSRKKAINPVTLSFFEGRFSLRVPPELGSSSVSRATFSAFPPGFNLRWTRRISLSALFVDR